MVAVTEAVVTVNVAVVAPAATVTLAGTAAIAVLALLNVTTAPPLGAALLNVTVPCEELPPVTVVGFSVTEERLAGGGGCVTVSVALLVTLLYVPEIAAEVFVAKEAVLTVNVAVVTLAATVTLAGTVATAVLALESATIAPPLGATLVRVTVPCDVLPPTTLVGFSVSEESVGAEGADCGVNVRIDDHEPFAPTALTPRTRHHNCLFGNPPTVACETVTDCVATYGELMLLESSI